MKSLEEAFGLESPRGAATPEDLKSYLIERANFHGVDPRLAASIFEQESSSGRNAGTSSAGARGPMQVMPATFRQMYPDGDINDPRHNVEAGIRYLKHGRDTLGTDDPRLLAAGYYQGYNRDSLKRGEIVDTNPDPRHPSVQRYADEVTGRVPRMKSLEEALGLEESSVFPIHKGEPQKTAPTPAKRNAFAYVNDFMIDAGNAVAGLAKAGVDFAAPGSAASQAIDEFIKQGQASQSDWKKASREKLNQDLQAAPDEWSKAGIYLSHAVVDDPLGLVAEAGGNIGPFAVFGKALQAARIAEPVAEKIAMGLASMLSVGEVRGNIYDKVQATPDAELQRVNPEYAAARQSMTEADAKKEFGTRFVQHLPELAVTAVVGALGGKYGLEGMAAGVGPRVGRAGRAVIGMADEGLQGAEEQLATNFGAARVDPRQTLTEDVGLNTAMEGLVGGVGGAMTGAQGRQPAQAPGAPPQPRQDATQPPPSTPPGVPPEAPPVAPAAPDDAGPGGGIPASAESLLPGNAAAVSEPPAQPQTWTEKGAQYRVVPVDEMLWHKYIRPDSQAKVDSFEEYRQRYPTITHMRLKSTDGGASWKPARAPFIGTEEKLLASRPPETPVTEAPEQGPTAADVAPEVTAMAAEPAPNPEQRPASPEAESQAPVVASGESQGDAGVAPGQAAEAPDRFDPGNLTPGSPEYERAYENWAGARQSSKDAANSVRRREENKAAVEKRNGWRARFREWFLRAKDGDSITDTGTEASWKVIEKTRKDGTKTKLLVVVDENGNQILGAPTGIGLVGDRVDGLEDGGIEEESGSAYLETQPQSLAAGLGKLMEEGEAVTRSVTETGPRDEDQPKSTVRDESQGQNPPSEDARSDLDAAAHAAATSPTNDLPEPTPPQKEAGNYQKGHIRIAGLDISIENPQGSKRSGVDRGGKSWEVEMSHHYGYIRGTVGKDKDHIDVFVKPGTPEDYDGPVFVVDQKDPGTHEFDEHKVMLGFDSLEEAKAAYRSNYAKDWRGMQAIGTLPMAEFKAWLREGDTTKSLVPVSGPKKEEPAKAPRKDKAPPTPKWVTALGINVGDQFLFRQEFDYVNAGDVMRVTEFSADSVRIWNDKKNAGTFLKRWQMEKAIRDGIAVQSAAPKEEGASTDAPAAKPRRNPNETSGSAADHRKKFLDAIRAMGGIDISHALDISGEKPFRANQLAPGLFKKSGRGVDEIAHRLYELGYITEAQYQEVDGGVQVARDLVRQALNKEAVYTLQELDEEAERQFERRLLSEADDLITPDELRELLEEAPPDTTTQEVEALLDDVDLLGLVDGPEDPDWDAMIEDARANAARGAKNADDSEGKTGARDSVGEETVGDPAQAERQREPGEDDPESAPEIAPGNETDDIATPPSGGVSASEGLELTGQTEDEARADAERIRAENRKQERERADSERAEKQERERKEIEARLDISSENFALGQTPEQVRDSFAGQGDLLGSNPPSDSDEKKRALDDLNDALGDLGEIFGKGFRKNITPEQEQKLLPVLTRVFDAAFRAGYYSFKDAAKFVLDRIRAALGSGVADELTDEHLQGAYIAMSGRHKVTGRVTPAATVVATSKEEVDGPTVDSGTEPGSAQIPSLGEDGGAADRGRGGEGEPGTAPGNGEVLGGTSPADVSAPGPGTDQESGGGARAEDGGSRDGQPGSRDVSDGREGAGGTGLAPDGTGNAGDVAAPPPPKQPTLGNYFIADPESLIGGSPRVRFDRNKAAIETFRLLQEEGRDATKEERDTLARYIGWGSFGQELFLGSWDRPRPKSGWEDADKWLRAHLGQKEWESAQRSIINAHYTDPPTVTTMWAMVRRMGFKGGRVLEPSVGIGNFLGLMPRDLEAASQLTGIELDALTGGMASMLYPDANIQIKGYQDSATADHFYDLVIGNWPFDSRGPSDRRYRLISPSLHDYFFLKAVDQVKPGGLVIGITSSGTMDKQGKLTRLDLARKADLIAAFRLPSGAFEKYAGTSVVTDIIVLRKRGEPNPHPNLSGWIETVEVSTPHGTPVRVNEYYKTNPDHVLGTLNWGHGTTQGRPGMIVDRPADLMQRLRGLAERVPEGIFDPRPGGKTLNYVRNSTADRENSVVEGDKGGLFVVRGEFMAPLHELVDYRVKDPKKTRAREDSLRALIKMRRAYGALVDAEREGAPEMEDRRKELNRQYQAFVKENGVLNRSDALTWMRKVGDPFWPSLAALERKAGDSYVPARILSEATVRTKRKLDKPSVRDAFVLGRNESMRIDMASIAQRAGVSEAVAAKELLDSGAVFKTPDGTYEARDVYLSGNVRRKMREALDAGASGQDMERNIAALKDVLPEDTPYYKIEAKLGAPWISIPYYRQYAADLLKLTDEQRDKLGIAFRLGAWKIKLDDEIERKPEARSVWGSSRVNFGRILAAAFNNTKITVWDQHSDGTRSVNEDETRLVSERIGRLREEFSDWVWKDYARRMDLEREFNEVMNAEADPQFDGSFLSLEGMALHRGDTPFSLRQHQINAIWRGLVNRRGVYAHEVGTGKTYTMGGLAVESRRYGLARKPLLLAHNANAKSVAREIQEMYPAARLLYLGGLDKEGLLVAMRQIANDDWDAVIIPHSRIGMFGLRKETLMAMAAEEIAAMEQEAIEAAEEKNIKLTVAMMDDFDDPKVSGRVRDATAKELVKARNAIIARIEDMAQKASKDGAIPFEELGIDMILVDEAHEFGKPPLATKMALRGLNKSTSNRSLSLRFLTSYVRSLNGGTGVHMFTGTPITNTLNEIYNLQRYVSQDIMERDGVSDWDSWFNTFADSTTDVELNAAGQYVPVTRLASFVNVAELRRMIGSYTDIVFADDMPEFAPRPTSTGKVMTDEGLTKDEIAELVNGRVEHPVGRPYKKIINDVGAMSPEQMTILKELQSLATMFKNAGGKARMEMMRAGHPASPVILETNASNAAMDARLYDMTAPDFEGSKVNRCVRNVARHYAEHPLATQVIFLERGFSDESIRTKKDSTGKVTKTKVKKFNLVNDIVEKLVAQGVKRSEIAVVAGGISDEKKKEIADAMNRAEIRVVIGQTATLGVGVNMQVNLRAMHHMDAPWRPGDLEQRNGRGHRQGNKWNTVLEYRYITDRLDGRRWQVVAVKERFIKAFLKADKNVRIIEGDAASMDEDDDILGSLSEAAGDPRILLLNKYKQDVERLENRQRTHMLGRQDAQYRLRSVLGEIEGLKKTLVLARKDAETVETLKDRDFAAEVNGKAFTDRKAFDEALKAHVETLGVEERDQKVASVYEIPLMVHRPRSNAPPEFTLKMALRQAVSPSSGSIEAVLRGAKNRAAKIEARIDELQRSIPSLEEAIVAPFPREADLTKKRDLYAQVEADLDINPVPPPAWLRQSAPVGTEIRVAGKAYPVSGHQYAKDGYYVIVETKDGARLVPYLFATDEAGQPLYEPRKFEAPPKRGPRPIKVGEFVTLNADKTHWKVKKAPYEVKNGDQKRTVLKIQSVEDEDNERVVGETDVTRDETDVGAKRWEIRKLELTPAELRRAKLAAGIADEEPRTADFDYLERMATAFSRSDRRTAPFRPSRAMRVRDVEAAIAPIRAVGRGLPTVHVVQHVKDLPRDLARSIRGDGSIVRGAFYRGQIYLIASNLSTPRESVFTLLHEAAHFGLQSIFGAEIDAVLMKIYRDNETVRRAADRRRARYPSLSQVKAVEEVLADWAGKNVEPSILQRLVAWVRDWFRRRGVQLEMTNADVLAIIARARTAWQRPSSAQWTHVYAAPRQSQRAPLRQQVAQLVDPATLTFREEQQHRLDEVRERFPEGEAYSPIVTVRDGPEREILDGHNRAAVAQERGDRIPVVDISRNAYEALSAAGFDDIEIAFAALVDADEADAAYSLNAQFPGAGVSTRGLRALELLDSFNPANQSAYSRSGESSEADFAASTLSLLSDIEDLYQQPKSDKKTVTEIAAEIDPGIKVQEIGSTAWNLEGTAFLTMPDGNVTMIRTYKDGAVDMDASALFEGQSRGSAAYNVAATFAHNTGRLFIGDPAGLTDAGLFRRTENMISSAMKFETTDHLYPHERQIAEGLQWEDGKDNLANLLKFSRDLLAREMPEAADLVYDFETQEYRNERTGENLDEAAFRDLAGNSRGARAARAGYSTLKRAALLNTLVRATGPEGRRNILGQVVRQLREGLDPDLKRIFYSRKSPPGSRPASAAPSQAPQQAGLDVSGLRQRAQTFLDRAKMEVDPFAFVPDRKALETMRYQLLGRIARFDEIAGDIKTIFSTASEEDQQAAYRYFLTPGADKAMIPNPSVAAMAERTKALIESVGDALVARGAMTPEVREAHRGRYLPQVYLKFLLGDQNWKALGAGKKISDRGYLKQRKLDRRVGDDGEVHVYDAQTGEVLDQEFLDAVLGPVEDPGYLSSLAIVRPLRDMAILDYLAAIAENAQWVLPKSVIEWRGKRVSAHWAKTEAERLRRQARHQDPHDAANARKIAEELDVLADEALGEIEGEHADYRQIPNTARYGRLRGIWVRKEIYDDLMGVNDFLPADPGFAMSLLGYGGIGTRLTSLWKAGKVSLNPPAQVRNFISNMVLLQLSGVPLRRIPTLFVRAFRQIMLYNEYRRGGRSLSPEERSRVRHYLVALKYGVTESTFNAQELYRMQRDLLEIERASGLLGTWGKIKLAVGAVMDYASDKYQLTEALGKTMKIMDEMERGQPEHEAALAAQEALFDYSLVSKNVRYLRNAPMGMPFLTFAVKVAPLLLKTARHHPERYLPWIALAYGLPALLAAAFDVDDDDIEALKKALPDWLQDRGHAYVLPWKDDTGRWQVLDMSYFFPWTAWTEPIRLAAEAEPGKTVQALGLFSGPLTDLITAVMTGRDSFTGREITTPGDPPKRQLLQIINYLWTMAMPPIITERGAAGHAIRAATGQTDRFGDPLSTAGQAALRAVGVNIYPIHPETSRATNVRRMMREIADTEYALRKRLQDRGLSDEGKADLVKEYIAEVDRRRQKLMDYIEQSEVHPNLATETLQ